VQLARHFQKAGILDKAVEYLHKAGKRAAHLSANEEAIVHYKKALELLKKLPETPEKVQKEIALQLDFTVPIVALKGYGAPEGLQAIFRARDLCHQIKESPQYFTVLVQLATHFAFVRAEYRTALEYQEQINEIVEKTKDPLQKAISFYTTVWAFFNIGELTQTVEHAYKSGHPHTTAFALTGACEMDWFVGDKKAAKPHLEELTKISNEKGFIYWQAHAVFYQGEKTILDGKIEEGIAQMQQGLAMIKATGMQTCFTRLLARMAEACLKTGQIEEGLKAIHEAGEFREKYDERYMEPEHYRLKGELLLKKGESEDQVMKLFEQAVQVSKKQKAKSLELRAKMSLSRLLQKQGKKREAHKFLEETYQWFTEGFDTADLKQAKALLKELE
jgi:tetratricopeptide (TPR) repeat protein